MVVEGVCGGVCIWCAVFAGLVCCVECRRALMAIILILNFWDVLGSPDASQKYATEGRECLGFREGSESIE